MVHRAPRRAPRRVVAAFVLALTVVLSGVVSNPAVNAFEPAPGGSGRTSLLDMGMGLASIVPPSFWAAVGQSQTIEPGPDGVLNILLLGSDARSGGVSRTDTIMVVSLKGNTIRAASIPRDTAKIPNPNGGTFSGRINAILKTLKNSSTSTEVALQKLEVVIENLLQIPIDYHALITFNGFHALVDVVDPITITTREIRDSRYWDDPTRTPGVYFPARTDYQLHAWQPNATPPLCNGKWKTLGTADPDLWCRRAMPYVRSRKGAGNSDFKRAKRQQEFIFATVKDVGAAHLSPLLTAATAQDASNQLYTSFPITIGNVQDFFNRLQNAQFGNHVVFGPTTYSTHIPGTTAYQLKLDVVRNWANDNLQ